MVALGGILIIIGLVLIFNAPLIGAPLIGIGAWLALSHRPQKQGDTTAAFFGLCLVCMVIVGAVALFQVVF